MKKLVFIATLATSLMAYGADLQTADTMEEALALAKEKHGYVMMNFTGTDWCTACIHLKEKILTTDAFAEAYGDILVMTSVDFPRLPELRAKISQEEAARREALLNSYQVRGLPTAVLFDAFGFPFAIINGARPTLEDYKPLIDEALAIREKRDAALKAAAGLQGMERATALANALNLLPAPCRDKYRALVEEINLLDPENTLGYRNVLGKSEAYIKQMAALQEITQKFVGRFKKEELKENIAILEDFLKTPNLEGDVRQLALRAMGDSYAFLREEEKMLECYEEAVKASPESPIVRRLQANVDYTKKRFEEAKKAKQAQPEAQEQK
jgi:thioredoxin-related protein